MLMDAENKQKSLSHEEKIKLYDSQATRVKEMGIFESCEELIREYGPDILGEIESAKVSEYMATLPEEYRDCLYFELPQEIKYVIAEIGDGSSCYDVIKDQRKEELETELYDPGSRKKILYTELVKKYGESLASKALQEYKKHGEYNTKTWQEMKDIDKGKLKKSKAKIKQPTTNAIIVAEPEIVVPNIVVEGEDLIQKEREKGDDYFLKLERGIIRNPYYLKVFKKYGRSVVYEYLWSKIVREGWIDLPGYPIKAQYYNNGYLAYCTSDRKLADDCFIDKNTVNNILNEFNEAGIIKVEHIIPQGKKYGQTVAILGEWRTVKKNGVQKIVERYYRDEAFLAPAADVPFQFKK